MIYCNLRGGLGNMLFQMAATFAFAKANNTDASFPNMSTHLNYLNNEKEYNPSLNHSQEYLNIFKNCLFHPPPSAIRYCEYPFEYVDVVAPDNCIISGFFQSEKYFKTFREDILKYFTPSEEVIKKVDIACKKLPKNYNVIHVRRGDYLKSPNYHFNLPLEYYLEGMQIINSSTPYVVFSDDISWCKENFIGSEFIFIENEKDYVELFVMSRAANFIISNSSFSWWGAWLSEKNNKKVIAPNNWFGPDARHINTKDIIPSEWIKI
jgi:hypothetical protein